MRHHLPFSVTSHNTLVMDTNVFLKTVFEIILTLKEYPSKSSSEKNKTIQRRNRQIVA
jgi:hypothetical protein